MSTEGVTLVTRAALLIFLGIVASVIRALIGRGKTRDRLMTAGTLGGIAFGLLLSYPLSYWFETDVSVLCVCCGLVLGWMVSFSVARRIPREGN
jgi:multisubunit Na+/H+ antiporter MnhF subunit